MTENLFHQTDEYRIASESLRFHDVDPRFSEIVYHATTAGALPSIAEHGLREYGKGWRDNAVWFDSLRPESIPTSMEHSIFAQVQGGHIIDVFVDGPYMHSNSEFTPDSKTVEMLALAVDPDSAFVIDMRATERARLSMKDKDAHDAWRDAMPLRQFFELYARRPDGIKFGQLDNWSYTGLREDDSYALWQLKNESDKNEEAGIPLIFFWPEVLVPVDDNGTIPPNRIEHHATSTKGRIFTDDELSEYIDRTEEEFLVKRRQKQAAEKAGKLLVKD